MKSRAWEPPFKVVADHRTSCVFLVYNQSGNFFPDESIEAMDATAKFIEEACNKIERYEKALRFYADERGYVPRIDMPAEVYSDGGARARAELEVKE